jgi:hypothetical protein
LKDRRQAVRSVSLRAGDQLGVSVERDPDIAVPSPGRDLLEIEAGGDEERDYAVPCLVQRAIVEPSSDQGAKMATVFIDGIGAEYGLPGGNLTTTLLELDVSKYYEVRGFFGKKEGKEITITLQVVRPNNPDETPAAGGGTVIGTLDTFALPDGQSFSRSYTTPGLWLQVLATTGPESARIGQLAFIGRE